MRHCILGPIILLMIVLSVTANDAPWRKVLTGADAQRSQLLEQQAIALDASGKTAEAAKAAKEMLELRARLLGEDHWQTKDARWMAAWFEKAANLPPAERSRVEKAREHFNTYNQLRREGKLAAALEPMRQARALYAELAGEDHFFTATSDSNLAGTLYDLGRFAEAEEPFRRALAVRQKVLGDYHPYTVMSLHNLGGCLLAQGKYVEAEPLFRETLQARRQLLGDLHPETAHVYTNLASLRSSMGMPAEAEPLFRKSLEIHRGLYGEDQPQTGQAYNNLAANLISQARHAEAEPLLRKVLDIYLRRLGPKHRLTALAYHNIGSCLNSQHQYADARDHLTRALALCREVQGADHPETIAMLAGLANHHMACKQYAEAEPLLRQALESRRRVLGEEHPDTAVSWNSLGRNLLLEGKFAECEPCQRRALEIHRTVLGDKHPLVARSGGDLAASYYLLKKFPEAETAGRAAVTAFEEGRRQVSFRGLGRTAYTARHSPRTVLAASLLHNGKPVEAWQQLEANLARGLLDELAVRPYTPEERQREQSLLPQLAQIEGRLTALSGAPRGSADAALKEARTRRDALQTDLVQLQADLTAKYGVAAGQVYDLPRVQAQLPATGAIIAWLDIPAHPKAPDTTGEHWGCVVRAQGDPVWVRLTGTGAQGVWTEQDEQLPERVRAALAERPADAATTISELLPALYRQRLAPLEKALQAGEKLPAAKHLFVLPAGRMAGLPVETLSEQYIITYAPSGTVLAWLQEKQKQKKPTDQPGALLALGDPVFAPKGDAPVVEAPVQGVYVAQVVPGSVAARHGLQPGDVLLQYAGMKLNAAADLVAAVQQAQGIVPLSRWREGQTAEVKVPAGPLGIQLGNRPLAEELAARRAADALTRAGRKQAYAALPGTRREVQALASRFAKAEVLLGSDASEQRLDELARQDRLRQYAYVHLATHCEIDEDQPGQSALILAQDRLGDPVTAALAGERVYQGRLTVQHILHHWKLDADLLTLSACRTGLGRDSGGEGYLGFAQALFLAGSQSLVLSLWPVDDVATALLMTRFYENLTGQRKDLKQRLPKGEALREARQWLRGLTLPDIEQHVAGWPAQVRGEVRERLPMGKPAGTRPYAHPYYWAAFILLGSAE
ncbi:MAG: tetratricopeptide repeat protein [Planctomycetia bacterium]|nr:tetratricopeptide repeat protein [Planctomycetia bacterium]